MGKNAFERSVSVPDPQVTTVRFWEDAAKSRSVTGSEIRYFGIVKRIPVDAFPRTLPELQHMALEWDESPRSLLRDLPLTVPTSMQGWEPVPNAVLEKFEAFDKDSGEFLIFWRIPCRRRG